MTIRIAVIGAGDVAQRDYLPEFGRLGPRAELAAVFSRSEVRAREVARRYDVPRWTTSLAEILASPDVDAILNLTPIAAHASVTLSALRAGKHVYSEKPLAPTSGTAHEIAFEAHSRGLKVVAAPSVALFPQVVYAAETLRSGKLGAVYSARAHGFGGVPPWPGYLSDPTSFFASTAGPLRDMAVYPLHALTALFGPVRHVSALSSWTRREFVPADGPASGRTVPVDVPDNWHLILSFDEGRLATVQTNTCAAPPASPELELQGERGALALSLLDVGATLLLSTSRGRREIRVPSERSAGPDHLLGVEHLVDCIEANAEPILNVAHAAHVIDVLNAARRSAEGGHEVIAVAATRHANGAPSAFVRPRV